MSSTADARPVVRRMSNVLFLDDNQDRLTAAVATYSEGNDLRLARTAGEAINYLQIVGQWDLVSLDHDLGGEVYVDSGREDCGMEVVRWIVENNPAIKRVLVHSWNAPAAREMVLSLRRAGYVAYYQPFQVSA